MKDKREYQLTDFLPTTKKELEIRHWDEVDVILFSGDAYVDHPSFAGAVVGRILEHEGLRVAIIPQPNWRDDLRDFKKLGRPRLFFAISAGCMDSMVNHYTANKRLRSDDAYSPNGVAGFRPDRATIVYCSILKKLFPDIPIVIGGIEASLRRVTHYDYWDDELKPCILQDCKADLLIYGMGELPLKAIVKELKAGKKVSELTDIPQTAYLTETSNIPESSVETFTLFSHLECLKDKMKQAKNFRVVEEESNKLVARRLIQGVDKTHSVVINPPFPPMSTNDIDATYELPFTRLPHPKYKGKTIPAYDMIKFSVNIHRGCFGGCSFCAISAHQGKFISSRSEESIIKEVTLLTHHPEFKGYISDLGGPSANMYKMRGKDASLCAKCKRYSCLHPIVCKNMNTDHSTLLELYKKVDRLPLIKKTFIGSGVRYDLILCNGSDEKENQSHHLYMEELITNHVSGRLKVAPEHTSDNVLKLMRKPSFKQFEEFKKHFDRINKENGMNQQLIPYFISSHPGCTQEDMAELACITKNLDFKLEQIQDFTPTPMTLATEIYYTGIHPYTLEKVWTPRSKEEKLEQRKFFFWYKKENQRSIINDLRKMNRDDLIQQLFSNHASHNSTPHSNNSSKASFKNAKDTTSKNTYKNESSKRSNASSKSFSKHEGHKNVNKNNNTPRHKR
jgi:uncharacterized radical SAM protein YgiQ